MTVSPYEMRKNGWTATSGTTEGLVSFEIQDKKGNSKGQWTFPLTYSDKSFFSDSGCDDVCKKCRQFWHPEAARQRSTCQNFQYQHLPPWKSGIRSEKSAGYLCNG